jgi:hypothetical protein
MAHSPRRLKAPSPRCSAGALQDVFWDFGGVSDFWRGSERGDVVWPVDLFLFCVPWFLEQPLVFSRIYHAVHRRRGCPGKPYQFGRLPMRELNSVSESHDAKLPAIFSDDSRFFPQLIVSPHRSKSRNDCRGQDGSNAESKQPSLD